MSIMQSIMQRAKKRKKRIVLPEWYDDRILKAAEIITRQEIAQVVLVGNPDEIKRVSDGIDLDGVSIINPDEPTKFNYYAEQFFEMRKSKGISIEKARSSMKNPIHYGTMMVKYDDADGLVAGAASCTADVWRPVLQIIKTRSGTKVASSCFLMEMPDPKHGDNGVLFFADCALNPNPTAEQLASIAVSTANTAKRLLNIEPRVAMLSFSTKGSACHELVDKVIEATRLVKELMPNLLIDGEMQADAALDLAVSRKKCPDSPVAGKANILIFPDLQSANIAYKLVQRLSGASAIGPISQGLAKPVNDLSRGCSVEDIVGVVAITALEAQNFNEGNVL